MGKPKSKIAKGSKSKTLLMSALADSIRVKKHLKSQQPSPNKKPKKLTKNQEREQKECRERNARIPYRREQRILLVGEGNFSFASALAQSVFEGDGSNIVATSFDSKADAIEKYPDTKDHVATVLAAGGSVLYKVDATSLDTVKALRESMFDIVVFNFPHVGAGIQDQERNINVNKQLVRGFLRSAAMVVNGTGPKTDGFDSGDESASDPEDIVCAKGQREKRSKKSNNQNAKIELSRSGEIHITIKRGLPYSKWGIVRLASLEGYSHRRTIGYKDGLSKLENEEISKDGSVTYVFVRKGDRSHLQAQGTT